MGECFKWYPVALMYIAVANGVGRRTRPHF